MHVLRAAAAIALTAGLAGGALAQGGSLVRNGDFEANGPLASWLSVRAGSPAIAGWRVTSGYVDLVGRWWQPAGGADSLEVGTPGPGAVEQRIATVAGRRYRLSFALAGNPEGPPRVKTLLVRAGPASRRFSFDTAGHTRQAMGWRTETLDFTAAAGTTVIGFARTDGSPRSGWYGPAVDEVTVVEAGAPAAPAPAATAAGSAAAATVAPAFTPSGGDPYGGLWNAAYADKPLRVYLERHGDQVSARVVDGGPALPTGRLAWSGRVDRSPLVVLAACADPDAKGWHGAVIEWLHQDTFRLHVADCHAGDVIYTRWR